MEFDPYLYGIRSMFHGKLTRMDTSGRKYFEAGLEAAEGNLVGTANR